MAIRYGRQQDLEGVVFREPKLSPLKLEHYQACSCVAILTEASRFLSERRDGSQSLQPLTGRAQLEGSLDKDVSQLLAVSELLRNQPKDEFLVGTTHVVESPWSWRVRPSWIQILSPSSANSVT